MNLVFDRWAICTLLRSAASHSKRNYNVIHSLWQLNPLTLWIRISICNNIWKEFCSTNWWPKGRDESSWERIIVKYTCACARGLRRTLAAPPWWSSRESPACQKSHYEVIKVITRAKETRSRVWEMKTPKRALCGSKMYKIDAFYS